MLSKKCKRIFSLVLAGILTVSSPLASSLRGNAAGISRAASMEEGLSYTEADFGGTVFNGTNVFEVPASDIMLFKENIRSADSLEISITFQVTASARDYINLLEICNSADNSSSSSSAEEIALIVSKTGRVFLMTGGHKGSTDWQMDSGKLIADGASHRLTLSIAPSGLTFRMDDGAEKKMAADGNKNTKKFIQAFLGGTADGYTDWRSRLDSVTIGGLKQNSFQTANTFQNLNGKITSVTLSGANNISDITGSGVTAGMFAQDSLDNTWLFGGGIETQGRFAEIAGVRNYTGQFEEYVRWSKRVNSTLEGMQRYTINVGKEGQDAAAFAANLENYISKVQPKAVAYLIGPEDYSRGQEGIEAFKEALADIIAASLAMKENTGYAVIQLPHDVKDEKASANAALYANAARKVISEAAQANAERIAVVDHLSQTDNNEFKNTMLTEDGLLNANGHLEIAKQFTKQVYGETGGFPAISETWTAKEAPDRYLELMPQVTEFSDSLEVTMPESAEASEWKYILTAEDTEIVGTASGNPFTISELPSGSEYELTVQTKDGTVQFAAVSGFLSETDRTEEPGSAKLQKVLQNKLNNAEGPLTWLFMGDSITHAAAHTHGYDGIAQLFEKYVKEDLGRKDDFVINTAVSGATAERTIANLEQRLTKYKPDIVSIMLGTNDKRESSVFANYKANLKSIVNAAREANPDAFIILRSPTPATGGWQNNLSGENGAVAIMKSVAEEDGNILFIDQYTDWNKEISAYPYLFGSKYYLGDGVVHPGAAGHLRMTKQFIRECGLNTNTKIANLSYEFNYENEKSNIVPEAVISETNDGVTVSKSALQAAYANGNIGDMTVTLTDSNGRTYTKGSGIDGEEVIFGSLPASRRYMVKVTANMKGNTAKLVHFAEQEILLTTGKEAEDLQKELDKLSEMVKGAAGYYTQESFEALKKAYADAQKAMDDGETDAEILAGLLKKLQQSCEGLKEDAELKQLSEDLDASVAQYKNIISGQVKYTEASWKVFADAYAKAEQAQKEGVKDKAFLKQLLKALTDAYDGLTVQTLPAESEKLAAPVITSLKAVAEKKAAGVKITVQKVANADFCTVYRVYGGRVTEIGKTDANGVAYDQNPVSKKTVSYYAVAESANTKYQKSANGAAKSITVPASTKKVTAKLVKGKKQVRVSWKKVKGAKRYVIYRSEKKDSGYVRVKVVKKGKTVSFTDKRVKKGKKYYYRVAVNTKKGYSVPKTSKAVKVKK